MIGRPHHVAYDCRDPLALATFYSALLGLPVTFVSPDWVVVAASEQASGFAFQRAPGHVAPTWPDPSSAQQVHLDVMVDDLDTADAAVVALGATRLDRPDHVYADPAGHPFCLVLRPFWAPPVDGAPDLPTNDANDRPTTGPTRS